MSKISNPAQLKSAAPISGEDLQALPVKNIETAAAFYETRLGFSRVSHSGETAALTRDSVQLGLVLDTGHNPEKAGSLTFAVEDLDALHHELTEKGGNPGEFGIGHWNGGAYRTFFLREDENGYCYCFHHPL